jgi:hypothetical protein
MQKLRDTHVVPRPPLPARFSRWIPFAAGILLNVGASSFGDTPDTRDTTEQVAVYFVDHRTAVLLGVVLVGVAVMTFRAVAADLAERMSEGGHARASRIFDSATTIITALLLVALLLPLAGLSYVIGAEAPQSAKAVFELTLVATTVIALPLAVALLTIGVGLRRSTVVRPWFAWLNVVLGLVVLPGAGSFAHSGLFSPDVQQQVMFGALTIWLLTLGFGVTRPG